MSRFHLGPGVLLAMAVAVAFFLRRLLGEKGGVAVADGEQASDKPSGALDKPPDGGWDFTNIAKVLGGALAIVIAAAGTIGATTGQFAYLYRNEPGLVLGGLALGLLAAAVATAVSALPKSWHWGYRSALFFVSFVFLLGGLAAVVFAQDKTQDIAARPTLSTEWVVVNEEWMLQVTTEARFLRRHQILHLLVEGYPVVEGRLGEPGTLFRSFTGPDEDGTSAQTQLVAIPNAPRFFTAIQVLAVVLDVEDPREPRFDTCSLSPLPTVSSEFRLAQVACAFFPVVPPASTPEPSASPSSTPAP